MATEASGSDGHTFSTFMTEVKEIEKRDSVLTNDQQIERLTRPGSTYFNLNPYEVLQVLPTATAEEIKKKYRKLSFLVHPDKNLDDKDQAQKAFEAVNKAYKTLQDEEQTKRINEILEEATVIVKEKIKEKKKQAKKEGKEPIVEEEQDPEKFAKLLHTTTTKLFADYEIKRRVQEEKDQALRKRQREEEIAEEEKAKKKKEWEQKWDQSRTNRVESWRSFQAGGKSQSGKSGKPKKGRTAFKPPALKPEKR